MGGEAGRSWDVRTLGDIFFVDRTRSDGLPSAAPHVFTGVLFFASSVTVIFTRPALTSLLIFTAVLL